ncbi:hypothetical protein B296_00031330 [Ensete ventricosum]|uniref:Uncharacterized protein n=1 Tax=Ensete ventricosum TaxID=4639 RepID=A0A426X964_ENSVE|nr:hypothetical protein B296_00031330 [Ensete ventricosum]
MAKYTCLPPGEGSASRGRRSPRPRCPARLALHGPTGSGQPQGARRKHALTARSPGWSGNPIHPSRAGRCTVPSSIVASPMQWASLRSGQLAPSPWLPKTRICLTRLLHDGTYAGSKPGEEETSTPPPKHQ